MQGDRSPRGRALVVGASSAIGAAVAAELAAAGYELVLWGRDRPRLEAAAGRCGPGTSVEVVDVLDRSRSRAHVDALGPVAAVVWVSGVFDWGPADTADPEDWARVLDTNLTAAARFTPLLLPALLASAPSALVYLGSAAGRRAFPSNAAYVASKHGLQGLAAATWLDVRDRGVKVSVVHPGLVAAGAGLRSPAGQERPGDLLRPQDVAHAVRFVVDFPGTGCPVEIELQPQRTP